MTDVDGFVLSELASKVFKENGALTYVECWGDDVPDVGMKQAMADHKGLQTPFIAPCRSRA